VAPARVLGVAGSLGALAPGHAADLVVTDEHCAAKAVMRDGHWLAHGV
jgi:N-acetylglucosamine-6-phosphate deacetylase